MLTISGLELASLWACLALLLVMSRLLARAVRTVGCPPLVGALLAGGALRHSVLTSSAYTIIVTAAIITTALMAPLARRLVGSPAEPTAPDALRPAAVPAG